MNPVYKVAIEADFVFEENQEFLLEVFEKDKVTDIIGSHCFTLHQVITSLGRYEGKLENQVKKKLESKVYIVA